MNALHASITRLYCQDTCEGAAGRVRRFIITMFPPLVISTCVNFLQAFGELSRKRALHPWPGLQLRRSLHRFAMKVYATSAELDVLLHKQCVHPQHLMQDPTSPVIPPPVPPSLPKTPNCEYCCWCLQACPPVQPTLLLYQVHKSPWTMQNKTASSDFFHAYILPQLWEPIPTLHIRIVYNLNQNNSGDTTHKLKLIAPFNTIKAESRYSQMCLPWNIKTYFISWKTLVFVMMSTISMSKIMFRHTGAQQ